MPHQTPIFRDRVSTAKDRFTSIGAGVGFLAMTIATIFSPTTTSFLFAAAQFLAAGAIGGIIMRTTASIIAPSYYANKICEEGHPIVSSGDMSITHMVESANKGQKLYIGNGRAKNTIMVEQAVYDGQIAPTEHDKSIF